MEKVESRFQYNGESLADLVSGFRIREDVSQSFVSDLVGVDGSFITRLENGTRIGMESDLAIDLADLLTTSSSEAVPFLLLASGIPPHLVHHYVLGFTNEILADHSEPTTSVPESEGGILHEGREADLLAHAIQQEKPNPVGLNTTTERMQLKLEQRFLRSSYILVAEKLLESIRSGEYTELLPPESALCEIFQLSRGTIRQAIRLLRESGMVEPRQGVGTIILKRNEKTKSGSL